jgi:hypothetical protein
MGNGPSLSKSLKENEDILHNYDLIAVNFMGLTSEFMAYKPNIYVLCDPGFWFSPDTPETTHAKVRDFYRYMVEHVSWKIQFYIPYNAKKVKEIRKTLSQNDNIRLYYYNKTKVEGFRWFQYMILKQQWGMFRAENVIIAALLLAIYFDYKYIYLMGADSDWIKNIWVDEQNLIRSYDCHFYGKNDSVSSVKMHKIYLSLYYACRGYANIENYSKHCGVKIYNENPLSFINVFEKRCLKNSNL